MENVITCDKGEYIIKDEMTIVHVSSDGVATPTEKCLAYLEQNPMEDFEVRKVFLNNYNGYGKDCTFGYVDSRSDTQDAENSDEAIRNYAI